MTLSYLPCSSSCCAAAGHSLIPLRSILGNFRSLIPIDLPLRRSFFAVARQVFFGLPLCLFPPCGIQFMATFAGRISGRQKIWPVNWMRLFATISLRFLGCARLNTSSVLILSPQDIFKILRKQLKWNTSRRFVILVVIFHVSNAYKAVERIIESYSRSLTVRLITLDPQTVWSRLKTEHAFSNLLLISFSISPTFDWMLPISK